MNKILKIVIEILIVIVVIAAGYVGFRTISGVSSKNGVPKEVVITFDAQGFKEELLAEIQIGDSIIENKKRTPFGEVTEIKEVRPYKKVVENHKKNKYVDSVVEDYYSVEFIVTGTAYVTENEIKIGEVNLKVGDLWPVKSPNYALQALITRIDITD